MITAERLAELRHVAEQAVTMPDPFTPWWHRFHAEFTPGLVLELLDQGVFVPLAETVDPFEDVATTVGEHIIRTALGPIVDYSRDCGAFWMNTNGSHGPCALPLRHEGAHEGRYHR